MLDQEVDIKRKCIGNTVEGKSCNAYALLDSEYCLFHAPELAEFRLENSKEGGRNRKYVNISGESIRVKIENVNSVMGLVEEVISNLRTMDISVTQARALLAAAETSLKVLEYKELSDRVKKLEEAIENKAGNYHDSR